jgi:BCD family chlorophyll transporter-like MFS transporter
MIQADAKDDAKDTELMEQASHPSDAAHAPNAIGWLGIVRLGLVQTALGAIVVLTTSTMNRVMVVELMLPAMLPGALVALHYALQFLRPRWGYGSDTGGRRTPWILFGMSTLATGGVGAAIAIAVMEVNLTAGLLLATLAFTLVGIGVGAAGTNLLALLATRVAPERRAPAATIVWLMMIAGFVVTTITAGHHLDPYSSTRLVAVTAVVSLAALVLAVVALWNVEHVAGGSMSPSENNRAAPESAGSSSSCAAAAQPFMAALAEVWREPQARQFTIFVFISMLAYSMQDLILEPFAGIAFAMTPGQSTKLSGVQHAGVFAGMILVALSANGKLGFGTLRAWTIGGCIASAITLAGLVLAGISAPDWPLSHTVFLLGLANGAFAVAAIGTMMGLAGQGRAQREGVRMGMWGAAQAIAFGLGGFFGAVSADIIRQFGVAPGPAFTIVFALEAVLFLISARLAAAAIPHQAAVRPTPAEPSLPAGIVPLENRM